MGVSIPVLVIIISLHVIAFVLAVGAERRRSTATVVPDKYDEQTYCLYGTDASTVYGLTACGLLLISQTVVNGVTRVSFLGAEACLLAGSARNAYHTKYRANFHIEHLSCTTLRKGVFAAGAALTLLSMMGSILYYWSHSKADTGGWEKHNNEGVGMTTSSFAENQQHQKSSGF